MESIVICRSGYIAYTETPSKRFIFFNANKTEKKELILFCDAVDKLILALPKAVEKANSLSDAQIVENQENLFYEDLSTFSGHDDKTNKMLLFKNRLSVNTYQGNAYIWIRRLFYDSDKNGWLACKGGFRFNPKTDDFANIMEWLQNKVDACKASYFQLNALAAALPENTFSTQQQQIDEEIPMEIVEDN